MTNGDLRWHQRRHRLWHVRGDGKQRWSGTAGSQIVGPADGIAMAIGGGLLVVPAENVLTASGN